MRTSVMERPGRMTQLDRPSSSRHGFPSRRYEIYVGIIGVGESTDRNPELCFFCCGTFADGKEVSQFSYPVWRGTSSDKLCKIIEGGACNFAGSVKKGDYVIYEIKNGIIHGIGISKPENCLSAAQLDLFREYLKKYVPSGVESV